MLFGIFHQRVEGLPNSAQIRGVRATRGARTTNPLYPRGTFRRIDLFHPHDLVVLVSVHLEQVKTATRTKHTVNPERANHSTDHLPSCINHSQIGRVTRLE